jgi:predicted Rossmann-fold nucleotide-binding protein
LTIQAILFIIYYGVKKGFMEDGEQGTGDRGRQVSGFNLAICKKSESERRGMSED